MMINNVSKMKELREKQESDRKKEQDSLPLFSNGLKIYYCFSFYSVEFKGKPIKWLKLSKNGLKAINAYGGKEETIEFCCGFETKEDVEKYIQNTEKDEFRFNESPKPGFAIYTGPEFTFHSDVYENHKLLELGESYKINGIQQYSSWTEVFLKSFPGKIFSLSFFKIK